MIVPSAIVLSETFEEETYCQIVKGDRRHLRSYHSDHQRINYHLLNCETRDSQVPQPTCSCQEQVREALIHEKKDFL